MKHLKEYFKDGFICPYCGSECVSSTEEPVNHGYCITQDVECLHYGDGKELDGCGKKWKEVYTLTKMKRLDVNEAIAEKGCEACELVASHVESKGVE